MAYRQVMIMTSLSLLAMAMTTCGPSRAQVERDEMIASHKKQCKEWEKMEAELRAEAESIKADDFEFRRRLSNTKIDKILLCEKYKNAESCNTFFAALEPEKKYLVRTSRLR
jgi:competence protein ComGF